MIKSNDEAYILGLWCADGYHRTSSVGLSNINPELIRRFSEFLRSQYPPHRLRLRIYIPDGAVVDDGLLGSIAKTKCCKVRKARRTAYHIYVNSRPLLRSFIKARNERLQMKRDFILPYIAGRFDGDGSVNSNLKKDFRIVYRNYEDAESDSRLLRRIHPYRISIYRYKKARTYCVYVSQKDAPKLAKELLPYSANLQAMTTSPRRD